MKTIVQMTVAASLLLAAVTGSFSIAQTASPPPSQQGQGEASTGITLRGSDILNAKVFSQQGDELGHVRDFLLDPQTGNISYAVLGMGGWQGIGEKFAIVPWNLIKQDPQKAENYILQGDREKFRTAPTFERDQWATVLQPAYLTKVQQHFSAPSAPLQQQPQVSQQPAPPSPPTVTSEPKAAPEPQQKRQAQQRSSKETQQADRKQRHSSKSGTVGTDDAPK